MNVGDVWGATEELPMTWMEAERRRMIDEVSDYIEHRMMEGGGASGGPLCLDLHLLLKDGSADVDLFVAFRDKQYDNISAGRAENAYDRMTDITTFWMMCSWLSKGFAHHGLTDTAICTKLMINSNQLAAMYEGNQKKFCFAGVATVKMTAREFVKLEK